MECDCKEYWKHQIGCHNCKKCTKCCKCGPTKEELIEHLIAVTVQGCSPIFLYGKSSDLKGCREESGICSNHISAYADSIRLLAQLGALEIIVERGDYIEAIVFECPKQP